MITQTYHGLHGDSEKYGRELNQDCSVKRVMSAQELAFIRAEEKLRKHNILTLT